MHKLIDPEWEYVPDAVMGGVSTGQLTHGDVRGRTARHLTGDVSLENNGGFIQMAFDFCPQGAPFDASSWDGLELTLSGNAQEYELRLRTSDLDRPWQSYRIVFDALPEWTTHRFAFADLEPHRTDTLFDSQHLRRCGLVAVGRTFTVDLAVSMVRLYRNAAAQTS